MRKQEGELGRKSAMVELQGTSRIRILYGRTMESLKASRFRLKGTNTINEVHEVVTVKVMIMQSSQYKSSINALIFSRCTSVWPTHGIPATVPDDPPQTVL